MLCEFCSRHLSGIGEQLLVPVLEAVGARGWTLPPDPAVNLLVIRACCTLNLICLQKSLEGRSMSRRSWYNKLTRPYKAPCVKPPVESDVADGTPMRVK
jgi:hypothetical protein